MDDTTQFKAPAARKGCFARFRIDRRGATAVEFGLVAVPFLGLLCAIFEMAFVFLASGGLDAAVQEAGRQVMTGQAQSYSGTVITGDDFAAKYLCPANGRRILPSFIPCGLLIVDVRTASAFTSVNATADFYKYPATQRPFCPGAPGVITVVRVAYPMPVFMPILGYVGGKLGVITAGLVNDVPGNPGWKHLLLSSVVFQTEPYPSANYTANASCTGS